MRKSLALFLAIVFCSAAKSSALYSVSNTGNWPDSWPKELEQLRGHSKTYVGPMFENRHYLIPFTKREQFEAAWPQLLTVKSKSAPIILRRARKTDFMKVGSAGVIVHTPPIYKDREADREEPILGQDNPHATWMKTSYIELVVDGEIVDLNRIPLPADTPIIDQRFDDDKSAKPVSQ